MLQALIAIAIVILLIFLLFKFAKWILKGVWLLLKGLWWILAFLLMLPFTLFIKRAEKKTQQKLYEQWKEERDFEREKEYLYKTGKIVNLFDEKTRINSN